ncbi:MAG: YIP1 family protein [Chloroflexi bacterium]|nr:YIP1 family protein [Chloroflexota bacterium]
MLETNAVPTEEIKKKADWSWLIKIFIRPRQTILKVVEADKAVWFPALLVLCVAAVILAAANGVIKQKIGLDNPAQLPEYFQYYTLEQQEQYRQALQATSGTEFIFVLPAIAAVAKVWLGWLIVGSLVYLVLTAMGSAVKAGTALNLVAWASMPFALRDLVRAAAVFSSGSLIQTQGLAGFTPAGTGNLNLFMNALLSLIDIYWIWQVILVISGARAAGKVSTTKTVTGITVTMLIILILQALIGFGAALLGSNVTAIQVFM